MSESATSSTSSGSSSSAIPMERLFGMVPKDFKMIPGLKYEDKFVNELSAKGIYLRYKKEIIRKYLFLKFLCTYLPMYK